MPDVIESRSTCFKIHGDWLTEFCRTRAYEERAWQHAIDTLVSGIADFSYDNAVASLKGEKQLVGINDLELIDEDPAVTAEVQARCDQVYGGLYRDSSYQYFEPYAFVSGWCRDDLLGPGRVNNRRHPYPATDRYGNQDPAKDKLWRSMAYASDPARDFAVYITVPDSVRMQTSMALFAEVVVLFRPVESGPPFWVVTYNDEQEAMDAWLHCPGHQLENRDGITKYMPQHPVQKPEELRREPAPGLLNQLALDAAANMGIDPAAVLSTLEAVQGTQDRDSEPFVDKALMHAHGWITPDGKFYPCQFHEHDALGARLLKHVFKQPVPEETNACDVKCEELGCLKITTGLGVLPRITWAKEPNKAQWATAFDWCVRHGIDYKTAGLPELE